MPHQLELPAISREGHLHECLVWLLTHGLECSLATRKMHADHARFLVAFFGDVHIKSIRYQDIRRYYDAEQVRGIARETIRKRLSTLHMAMEEAVRRELMDRLPPWVVIKTDTRPKEAFWTLEQWQAADAVCDDEELRIWVACGWWTGMHTSDLNRFRWSDVDLWKKTWIRRCTKSKAQPLALPMPDRLHEILLARFGQLQPHPRDLVAGRNMGNPNRAMKALSHRAGVPLIGPINLRHSCETYLEETGADLLFQVTVLGHKSPKMALTVYRHATERTLERGIAAVNAGRR